MARGIFGTAKPKISSNASHGEEGLRGHLRDLRKELALKKKAGKPTESISREIEKTKNELAEYQREVTKKVKKTSWYI